VLRKKITLHVVPDDFPISQDGILGSKFLQNMGRINFVEQTVDWRNASFPFSEREQETIQIPARSNKVLFVKVAEITTGYVPRLQINSDVYLGDAVVTNRDGKAYLRAFNTGCNDTFQIPSIKLEEIDIVSESHNCLGDSSLGFEASMQSSRNLGRVSQNCKINSITKSIENRADAVKNLLQLEHLNDEESERPTHHQTQRHVSHTSDKLGHTNAIMR